MVSPDRQAHTKLLRSRTATDMDGTLQGIMEMKSFFLDYKKTFKSDLSCKNMFYPVSQLLKPKRREL